MSYEQAMIYDTKSIMAMKDSFVGIGNRYIKDASVAVSGNYLEQQLTYILPKVFKQKYPARPALDIFNISNEGALEKLLVRRIKGYQGQHQRDVDNAGNPSKGVITVAYDATSMRIDDFSAVSYYKQLDLQRAIKFNDPLDASIIEGHDESYKTRMDRIAFLGMQDESGTTLVEGLLNNSLVDPSLSLNAGGTFQSYGSDGVAIYTQIKNLWEEMAAKTGGVEELMPDTMVCSPLTLALLRATTYGTGVTGIQNPMSVLEMVQKNLGITMVKSTNTAALLDGVGTTDRLCLFNRTEECMTLYIPQPLQFFEVFKDGPRYKIESNFRPAGLGINQRIAFGYLKGV